MFFVSMEVYVTFKFIILSEVLNLVELYVDNWSYHRASLNCHGICRDSRVPLEHRAASAHDKFSCASPVCRRTF
jgi:hypothetical protein